LGFGIIFRLKQLCNSISFDSRRHAKRIPLPGQIFKLTGVRDIAFPLFAEKITTANYGVEITDLIADSNQRSRNLEI
jgi:hypothetical protein